MSDLINANQKTRAEALIELREPSYPVDLQEKDLVFVASKFGFEKEEFLEIHRFGASMEKLQTNSKNKSFECKPQKKHKFCGPTTFFVQAIHFILWWRSFK